MIYTTIDNILVPKEAQEELKQLREEYFKAEPMMKLKEYARRVMMIEIKYGLGDYKPTGEQK